MSREEGVILLPLGNQKRKPTTFTENFVGKNLPNSPHFEQKKVEIAIFRLYVLATHQLIVRFQKQATFLSDL